MEKPKLRAIPREPGLDSTLALLREGYPFIINRCRRHRSELFQARLLGEKTIFLLGMDAAELFYNTERFRRQGAVPTRIVKTLTGMHGLQMLDGEEHDRRKSMFMSFMTPERLQLFRTLFVQRLQDRVEEWRASEQVDLFSDIGETLSWTACNWAGVPLPEPDLPLLTRDFEAMIYGFGRVGIPYWRGRRARARTEDLMRNIIARVRSERLPAPKESPAYQIANYETEDGELLRRGAAAVELMNIIRPIVAIANFITYSAHALHRFPEYREQIRLDPHFIEPFVHEVRRFYPFAPFISARVRKDFLWKGFHFERNRLVLLDLYGTNRDPRIWGEPERFLPERFERFPITPYNFMPQGGGGFTSGHRCAGEWLTISTMRAGVDFLARQLNYSVPEQNLEIPLNRIPARIVSGFIISNVRRREPSRSTEELRV